MSMPVLRMAAIAVTLVLGSCAVGEPREYTKTGDEIPEGPGLFTGKNGEFVLFGR